MKIDGENKKIKKNIAINTCDKSTISEFYKIKKYYYELFNDAKSLDYILEQYIDNTENKYLFDSLRLRILNMYLFNKCIIYKKYNLEELKSIITRKVLISNKTKKEVINKENTGKSTQQLVSKSTSKQLSQIKQKEIYNIVLSYLNMDEKIDYHSKIIRALMEIYLNLELYKNTNFNYVKEVYNIIKTVDINGIILDEDYIKQYFDKMIYLEKIFYLDKEKEVYQSSEVLFCEFNILVRYEDVYISWELRKNDRTMFSKKENMGDYIISIEDEIFMCDFETMNKIENLVKRHNENILTQWYRDSIKSDLDYDKYKEIIIDISNYFNNIIKYLRKSNIDINETILLMLIKANLNNKVILDENCLYIIFLKLKHIIPNLDIKNTKELRKKLNDILVIESLEKNIRQLPTNKQIISFTIYKRYILLIDANSELTLIEFEEGSKIKLFVSELSDVLAKSLNICDKTLYYKIEIMNENFIMNANDILNVYKYYEKYNLPILTMELEEKRKKLDLINKMKENISKTKDNIILSFLDIFPKEILLNPDLYINFEYIISRDNHWLNLTMDYLEFYFSDPIYLINREINCYDYIINDKGFSVKDLINYNQDTKFDIICLNEKIYQIKGDIKTYTEITRIKADIFDKYIKLIFKYADNKNLDNWVYIAVGWELLKKYSISYFADKWSKKYGGYFKQDNDLKFRDMVRIYCNIGEIDPLDTNTIGEFTYYLINLNKIGRYTNFLSSNSLVTFNIKKVLKELEIDRFEKKLLGNVVDKEIKYTIHDVDLMTGYEFEEFISELFTKMGYSTHISKMSGDQGVDIILGKYGNKIGVQAKRYSSKVTNSAIQEVVAGLKYYRCSRGMVITNNYFTESAIELASVNNIILWDRDLLEQKINEIY